MHSKGYSSRCSLVRLLRVAEIDVESINCPVDDVIGFVMLRLGGRLTRSCSKSLERDMPVREGM